MSRPFEVLGVEPDADEREVEAAYRRRVKEAHPDHGGSKAEFQRVREAYQQIRDGDVPESEGDDGDVVPGGMSVDGSPDGRNEEPVDPETSVVKYLDYEVLDDHGWSMDDDGLFEKAARADLDDTDYGRFVAHRNETLLEAAEERGYAWPFACRGGACANCAVAVVEGELSTPVNHVLPPEMTDRGIRLSCVGSPTTPELKVLFNVKHLPELEELLLSPSRFEKAQADD